MSLVTIPLLNGFNRNEMPHDVMSYVPDNDDANNNSNNTNIDNGGDNNNSCNNDERTPKRHDEIPLSLKLPPVEAVSSGNADLGSKADVKSSMSIEVPQLEVVPRLYRRRWLIVFLFASYSMTNNYQWIHLSIIGDKILFYYNASLPDSQYQQEMALDWLSMVYMLAYIPLIFPATWLLDRYGLRVTAIVGALLNAVGAWIKCAAIDPSRFAVLMTAQTVCAVGQVFILGIPARLAAVWFGPGEVSTATSIGVFGSQMGAALGFLVTPEIVTNGEDVDVTGYQLSIVMYSGAALTTALFILVVILFRRSPPVPPSLAQLAAVEALANEHYIVSLRRLITNLPFILLVITYGLNTGSYYEIGTLLNPIILHYFPGQTADAGRIGLTLVLSGLGGSLAGGIFLDRTKLYKSTTIFIYVMSCASMLAFSLTLQLDIIWIVYLCGGLLGFFMTGYLPVGFEFAAELTYPESEGTSSGLLNASAQIFGIALIMSIRAMMTNLPNGTLAGNLTISAVLFLGIIGTALIRSDLRRQKAQNKDLQSIETVHV